MAHVDQHAEPVHLRHPLPAERGEAVPAALAGGGIGLLIVAAVDRAGHGDAELVEGLQQGEILAPHDTSPERSAIERRQANWANLNAAERREVVAELARVEARRPFNDATFETYMQALLHSIRVMGADHVGLGADWDGGGGVIGMEDVSLLPRITARLRREGVADADIAKIMGGNLLRVLRQAQAGAERRSE